MSGSSTSAGPQQRQPAWVFLLALGCVGLAVAPFMVRVQGPKFWSFDYLLFLAAMLALPAALLYPKGRVLRGVVILFALAYFGFLQAACPRPVGAIELLLLNLLGDKPVLMHALKLGVLLGTALVFSRHFCGWICPKGVIQEYVHRRSLGVAVPLRLDRALKLGKYLMLAVLVLSPLIFEHRFFREFGPFKVIFNLEGSRATIIILAVVLAASVFVERAFCRYLCPVGGLLGLVTLLAPLRMRIRGDLCTGCGLCARACPTAAIVAVPKEGAKISASECVACLECQTACSKGGIRYGPRRFAEALSGGAGRARGETAREEPPAS